ncbi:four helix bundle protein [Crocinitomicaceae bacterium]|nr:four helix bundle protein [Crocinitomicaceae bacterium]
MHNYRELKFWSHSKSLAVNIYSKTKDFPDSEKFGLTSQLRRAAISVPSNIAEGSGRQSNKEFVRFLNIATGSLYELETQLEIANEIGLLNDKNFKILNNEVLSVIQMMTKFKMRISC